MKSDKSKLLKIEIYNLGCIGPEGLEIEIDNMLCLVGPNNSGKSTVLRAYELAVGNASLSRSDFCNRSADSQPPKVVLHIHIPTGTPNIDEEWKILDGDLRVVKSKWEWDASGTPSRATWDPHPDVNNWSTESKASGLDTVFSSRLPTPFRIGALDDPKEEHKKLLTLVLQPIADELKKSVKDENSELFKAIQAITTLAKAPVEREKVALAQMKNSINKTHNEVFPNLKVDFAIDIGSIQIDPIKLLLENSSLSFEEWEKRISWDKQGTGSQRALFWAMLQVRSELKSKNDAKIAQEKQIAEKQKAVDKLTKEASTAKKDETKKAKEAQIAELNQQILVLREEDTSRRVLEDRKELSLPGYMLLIDEPEVALHPNAVRAASRYLYGISKDPAWQVMLSTHSPVFIDPLEDHTTIVRLGRTEMNPTPKTYRSDSVTFSGDEKLNFKIMNRFDSGLSEMFFGQYPILIEGDTEYGCFEHLLNENPTKFPAIKRPILVRARGKYSLITLIKMLTEFKIDYSVLHDCDYPKNKKDQVNSAWTANIQIETAIKASRSNGCRVIHRVSVPYFELAHSKATLDSSGNVEDTEPKEKPWNMLTLLKTDASVRASIETLLNELTNPESLESQQTSGIEAFLTKEMTNWKKNNGVSDRRLLL